MALAKDWNQGGANLARGQGKPNLRDLMNGLHGVPDLATLRLISSEERSDGMIVRVVGAGQQRDFKWVDAATGLTDDSLLVLAASDTPATGFWVCADDHIDMKLPVGFGNADASVLYTVPTGFQLRLGVPWWEVTTSWTGGTSSAIGPSSSNAGLSTKGDLLGGASGDVAAGLLSTGALAKGTVGAKIGKPGCTLVAGDTIRFDQITSTFTAGAGFAHVPVFVLATP
jgi:hypothetical protein